jgi:hypothetical protein
MTNQRMTEKQYGLLVQLGFLIESMNKQDEEFKDLVDDSDVFDINIGYFKGELERRIEIFEMIKKYDAKEIKNTASIGISNTMAVVIIEAESDYVFGYLPYEGDKEFFLSEIEYKYYEDLDDIVAMFTIGEEGMELSLSDAIRINY